MRGKLITISNVNTRKDAGLIFEVNKKVHMGTIYEFEELLDYVVEYNCEILSGNLTKEQCILVDITRELYGDVDYE